ncbi:class I SAM-dependent methyltransferase [Streptomyces sp. AV19]|uniref:class I SAM-dependent methyltransferase n=1 Tax=Streptomyces sp. AV19 TaxID=2793068 RepID=UPI0018FEBF5F|nr:class I SAM-dependent methyltransferase [Streptomyces sp. AV19]MBH1937914.1 class I SAM-dependent methyltransferase [Streptomyces sp. AV19]MDG4536551.1 methyltransferase domain-containing protein [Streptomyces sp. AV19]
MAHDRHCPATRTFWEDFYRRDERVWSGEPNPLLVRETSALPAGTALDLGCGEGADAVWLARRGWRVTAVDVSPTALGRAAAHAAESGVADRVDWLQEDLSRSFPGGTYDLVSAQFLHSPVELPTERILRAAAGAVHVGGVLLVVGHAGLPAWVEADPAMRFLTPEEVLDAVGATSSRDWRVVARRSVRREVPGPEGQSGLRTDHVLKLRRIGGR